jgi:hypothetical protein
MTSRAEQHPFLEARHVDDLTDAVRALAHQTAEGNRLQQVGIDMQRRMLEVLADIRDSTNALQEVITRQHTNGHGHHHDEGSLP